MCEICDHCRHCSRSRRQLVEFWVVCRDGVTHTHPDIGTADFRPYVPEWAVPLARLPRDAA